MKKIIEEIKNNDVVYFSATWCNPCKITKPIVEKVSSEREEKIKIVVIDELDDSEFNDIKNEFHIKSVPTTLFFKDGYELDRKVGGFQEAELISIIEENKGL